MRDTSWYQKVGLIFVPIRINGEPIQTVCAQEGSDVRKAWNFVRVERLNVEKTTIFGKGDHAKVVPCCANASNLPRCLAQDIPGHQEAKLRPYTSTAQSANSR